MSYSLQDFHDLFEAHCERLMREPGVLSAGIGLRDGKEVFIILVDSEQDAERYRCHEPIGGLPVYVEVGQPVFVAATAERGCSSKRSWMTRLWRRWR